MNTASRTQPHRRAVAAATLLAALITVAQTAPARAQGLMAPPPGAAASLDQQTAWERRDLGIGPSPGLHDGGFHGPTPNQIPGGQLITTKGLAPLLQQGVQVHVFDVLGGPDTLPNAIPLVWAAQPGSFDDATQQQMGQMLRQVTRGQADAPLVFYCLSAECWMSYNAALRAIRLGYRNVLWYRGGIEAWKSAGLPTGRSPMPQGQPSPGYGPQAPPQGYAPQGAMPPAGYGQPASGRL
ncbi:MAG: rhodanese-like domain-containing protein [Burkholderiales bacterium]